MKTYTEEDLKRGFECGVTFGLGYAQERGGDPETCLRRNLDDVKDTPEWVHKTNSSLFLWQFVSWADVQHWILNPAAKGLSAKEHIALKNAGGGKYVTN
jgi:hypothetical protein